MNFWCYPTSVFNNLHPSMPPLTSSPLHTPPPPYFKVYIRYHFIHKYLQMCLEDKVFNLRICIARPLWKLLKGGFLYGTSKPTLNISTWVKIWHCWINLVSSIGLLKRVILFIPVNCFHFIHTYWTIGKLTYNK